MTKITRTHMFLIAKFMEAHPELVNFIKRATDFTSTQEKELWEMLTTALRHRFGTKFNKDQWRADLIKTWWDDYAYDLNRAYMRILANPAEAKLPAGYDKDLACRFLTVMGYDNVYRVLSCVKADTPPLANRRKNTKQLDQDSGIRIASCSTLKMVDSLPGQTCGPSLAVITLPQIAANPTPDSSNISQNATSSTSNCPQPIVSLILVSTPAHTKTAPRSLLRSNNMKHAGFVSSSKFVPIQPKTSENHSNSTPIIPKTSAESLPTSTLIVHETSEILPNATPIVPETFENSPNSIPVVPETIESPLKSTPSNLETPESSLTSTPIVPETSESPPTSMPIIPKTRESPPNSTPIIPKTSESSPTPIIPKSSECHRISTPAIPETSISHPTLTPIASVQSPPNSAPIAPEASECPQTPIILKTSESPPNLPPAIPETPESPTPIVADAETCDSPPTSSKKVPKTFESPPNSAPIIPVSETSESSPIVSETSRSPPTSKTIVSETSESPPASTPIVAETCDSPPTSTKKVPKTFERPSNSAPIIPVSETSESSPIVSETSKSPPTSNTIVPETSENFPTPIVLETSDSPSTPTVPETHRSPLPYTTSVKQKLYQCIPKLIKQELSIPSNSLSSSPVSPRNTPKKVASNSEQDQDDVFSPNFATEEALLAIAKEMTLESSLAKRKMELKQKLHRLNKRKVSAVDLLSKKLCLS